MALPRVWSSQVRLRTGRSGHRVTIRGPMVPGRRAGLGRVAVPPEGVAAWLDSPEGAMVEVAWVE